jgi:sortase A
MWKFSPMIIIPAALAAGIMAAVAVGPLWNHAAPPSPSYSSSSTSAVAMAASYSFNETAIPRQLIIPRINVNAKIQGVGIGKTGNMAVVDSYWDVGWYRKGPVPGALGNAVIEGHLDQVVSPYAVFSKLDQLKPGDEVDVIDTRGRIVRFEVIGSKSYPNNADTSEVFGSSNESHLNLITCTGDWIKSQHQYTDRLVVFTKRID